MSRWHDQTKVGGEAAPPEERGDCVPVCAEGILGLPPGTLPNVHGEGWWDRLQAALGEHGCCFACLDVALEPPPGLWMATLPSLNLGPAPDGKPTMHCVVARGYELVHDPSLGRKYDTEAWVKAWNEDKIAEGWVLVPLDPAEPAVREVAA